MVGPVLNPWPMENDMNRSYPPECDDDYTSAVNALGSGPSSIGKPGTFNQFAYTLNEADNLAMRVTELVGQLCGFRPETNSGSKEPHYGGDAPLPVLAERAASTSRTIKQAHSELDRLMSHFD